jgi:hypothetical protein
MFGFGKKKRTAKGKTSSGYSVIETPKGGSRGRFVHIFGFGKSAPKSEAQSMAVAMRKVSRDKYAGKYTYRVVKAR